MKKIILILSMVFILSTSIFANNAFVNIAGAGNLAQVEKRVNDGVDIDFKHSDTGKTALILASERGHTQVVEFLLNSRASVDSQDNEGKTALICASARSHIEIVKLLISNYADVNIVSECTTHSEMNGTIITTTSRTSALAETSDTEITRALLEARANVNTFSSEIMKFEGTDVTSGYILTPLVRASQRGNVEIVKLLIEAGANVNQEGYWHDHRITALGEASKNGHTEIARLLRAAGAR